MWVSVIRACLICLLGVGTPNANRSTGFIEKFQKINEIHAKMYEMVQ